MQLRYFQRFLEKHRSKAAKSSKEGRKSTKSSKVGKNRTKAAKSKVEKNNERKEKLMACAAKYIGTHRYDGGGECSKSFLVMMDCLNKRDLEDCYYAEESVCCVYFT